MESARIFAPNALAGEVALVTGASRGIGAAIAEALARAGAVVVGTATGEAGAAAITQHMQQAGCGAGASCST
jgi:3-oxoacyl-[acyl-carrier protein] reductase